MTPRLRWAFAAGAAAIVLLLILWSFRSRQQAQGGTPLPQVALSEARYGDYVDRVTAYGRAGVPAGTLTKPAFATAGILASIDVHVGQTVSAGEPLAHLDTRGLAITAAQARADAAAAAAGYGGGAVPQAQLQSAQAKLAAAAARLQALERGGATAQTDVVTARTTLQQAQIKLQTDQQTLLRQQRLFAAGIAARKDVDAAQALVRADEADVRANSSRVISTTSGIGSALTQARADYRQAASDVQNASAQRGVLGGQAASAGERAAAAQRDYANGTLHAPMDGVITAIYKHVSESVDATTPVLAIGPFSERVVTLEVAATDARSVRPGNPVSLRVAGNSAAGTGRVAGVGAAVDPATQRTTVVVRGAPPDTVAGSAIEATIFVGKERGILIPQSAIVEDPQTTQTVVFVRLHDGRFAQRFVHVAKEDGKTALLRSGVQPGEKIASQGAFQLLAPPGG